MKEVFASQDSHCDNGLGNLILQIENIIEMLVCNIRSDVALALTHPRAGFEYWLKLNLSYK